MVMKTKNNKKVEINKEIKKNKSGKLLAGMLVLVGVVSIGVYSIASAYQGNYTKKGPNYSVERYAIMKKAFENNDYETWRTEMEIFLKSTDRKVRVLEVINKDNFAKFAEVHKLAEEGKYAEADAIRKELGLRTRDGKGFRNHRRQGKNRGQNRGGHFTDIDGDGQCDNLK